MADSDLEHVPTLNIHKKINQSSYKKYFDLAIMRINIKMISLKKSDISGGYVTENGA